MHLLARESTDDFRNAAMLSGMRALLMWASPETGEVAGKDQTPCNCLALRQAARHLTLVYDRHLAQEDLRSTQYSILSKLSRLGPMPIGELADTMVVERTALGRALRPLQRDRL